MAETIKEIKIKLPYTTRQEFIERYASFIIPGGVFFRTKTPLPKGAAVSFVIELADGSAILKGAGVVADARPFDPKKPDALFGMAIAIKNIEDESQKVLNEALEYKSGAKKPTSSPKPPAQPPVSAQFKETSAPKPIPKAPEAKPAEVPRGFGRVVSQKGHTAAPVKEPSQPRAAYPKPEPNSESKEEKPAAPSELPSIPMPPAPEPKAAELAPEKQASSELPSLPTPAAESKPEPSAKPISGSRPKPYPKPPPKSDDDLGENRLVPPSDEELEKATGPIIGIDLGTTNSCASVVVNGKPMVIPSQRGYRTVPSLVAYNERNKIVVGHVAKSQFLLNPENTVYGSKRLIGRKYRSPIVQGLKKYFTYNIVEAPDGTVAVEVAGNRHSLPEIAAFILREIREVAQEYLKQPVQRAVITVPAYYNDSQRNAVRDAGKLAGLKVERIINEPTAAALAYGYNKKIQQQRIMVYDLGGGTFDSSILDLSGDLYEVISTGGNNFLGGIDFDNRLVDYFDEVFYQQFGIPLPNDRVVMQRVKFAAENAKIALSTQPTFDVHIPFIGMHQGKPLDLRLTVSREKLLQLTDDLVDKTLNVCDAVLAAKNLKRQDIDEVIIVGGQSRSPRVIEKLGAHFGKPPSKGIHPDEAVALGAALFADSINRSETGLLLIDVLPISIGLALPGGGYARIIARNTPLPYKKTFTIATTRDNQTDITLVVMQGESEAFSENEYLGMLKFDTLTPAPKGQNKLEVTFTISSESILKVTAKEQMTGKTLTAFMTYGDAPDDVKPGSQQPSVKPISGVETTSTPERPPSGQTAQRQPAQQQATAKPAAKTEGVSPAPQGRAELPVTDKDIEAQEAKTKQAEKKPGFFARLFGRKKKSPPKEE